MKKNIIIIILAVIILGLGIFICYDKFIKKPVQCEKCEEKLEEIEESANDYTGYYLACTTGFDGEEECAELVLNEDKSVYFMSNPVSPIFSFGSYTINEDSITIHSIYRLSGQVPGIDNAKYDLDIEDGKINYIFGLEEKTKFIFKKTTEEKLEQYNNLKVEKF